MRWRRGRSCLIVVLLTAAGTSFAADRPRAQRPRLELRARPTAAFSPAQVVIIGRLVGGEDLEEFYCPAFEWDWGDGERSVRESDCPPFDDQTKMARLFSLIHQYREPGDFRARLTLRRGGRLVATASVPIRVIGPGFEPGSADGLASVR
jgi:hypothetical protein